MTQLPRLDDSQILALRPERNHVSAWEPYHFLCEDEVTAAGRPEPVATIFLSNRECPFRCLMCDLWKNTLTERVPPGAIPRQIEFALERLPAARHIKLYNSGNFFDAQAIPPEDHDRIAELLQPFETIIVENHPRLCNDACVTFARKLQGQLEVAMGLETIHPDVLPRLNKRMTVDDFDRAAGFLLQHDIAVRTFLLLQPPLLLDDAEAWCLRSLDHAFAVGSSVCAVIATRAGNGVMDELESQGLFRRPTLTGLERVQAAAMQWRRGRVLVDLWEVEPFAECRDCAADRIARMQQMNLTQQILPQVSCAACGGAR